MIYMEMLLVPMILSGITILEDAQHIAKCLDFMQIGRLIHALQDVQETIVFIINQHMQTYQIKDVL
jgi:hypothetical protein